MAAYPLNDLLLGGFSVSNGLTAHAGGTQAAGLLLTSSINRLTTVATTADSVLLPLGTSNGQIVIIANDGANSATVYGSGTDTINSVATATGVALAATKRAMYICTQPITSTNASANWVMILTA